MQRKQGYLITAYKDYDALYELISFLSEEDKVFVHVDKKSTEIGEKEISELNELKNCTAISLYSVAWGSYNHVRAFLALLDMACKDEEISYLHFLTGEDFPVYSPQQIHERFVDEEHLYLNYIEEKDFNEAVQKRYRYYNFFPNKNAKNPVLRQLQNVIAGVQKIFGVNRKSLGEFDTIYKGLVYVSIPSDAGRDILSYVKNHPEYEKALYRCQLPEEFFFHTILLNETFCNGKWKKLIVDKDLRYMNWDRGDGASPVYLAEEDMPALMTGDWYFARKFHGGDSNSLKERIVEKFW
ncbi:MAG: hypothetical protein J1E61_00090 [Lachnospiraceae bacterium]|nr:hypothetical protein [Lachnospiraceae bacterium]